MKNMILKNVTNNNFNNLKFILLVLLIIGIVDFINWDNSIYQIICNNLKFKFITFCGNYYDLPIWAVLESFGTIIAGVFALLAIIQSNKQLEGEQTPHIVPGNISWPLTNIDIKNIGPGPAFRVSITSDKEGKLEIRNQAIPRYANLGIEKENIMFDQEYYLSLLNINREGLGNYTKEITLYIWYESASKKRYRTIAKFKVFKTHITNIDYYIEELKEVIINKKI